MHDRPASPLAASDLGVRVPGRTLVAGLDVKFSRGEFVAVLGQNGSGKTLTMLTLAGLRRPAAGRVLLDGRDIGSMKRSKIARRLALMPQDVDDAFPTTVLDTALVGRHPHLGSLQWEGRSDVDAAMAALAETGIDDLAYRDVMTLSGGERRRLAVAVVLAQTPDVYLLDEPTNHLDPQHQLDVLRIFRERANGGSTIVATLHDVNLAVRHADRCLLLYGDGRWDLGPTDAILDETSLGALYEIDIEAVEWRSRRLFVATDDAGGSPTRNR